MTAFPYASSDQKIVGPHFSLPQQLPPPL
ncbi:uncharacterized protein G2W53_021535 [Senna tora]|uniref:Uncharacterized protein n=1 Tax=Senna tora TaxID=362788 RepID=A0A834TM59_9FABA|nr:uncharacterized protein G2W53_021535 [Senna tora]